MRISPTVYGWLLLTTRQLVMGVERPKIEIEVHSIWATLWNETHKCVGVMAGEAEELTHGNRSIRFLDHGATRELPAGDFLLLVVCDSTTPPGNVQRLEGNMVPYIISPKVGCIKATPA